MRALYHDGTVPDGTALGTSRWDPKYASQWTFKQVQEAIERRIKAERGELAPHSSFGMGRPRPPGTRPASIEYLACAAG
jgi:hypothetical protein